MDNFCSFVKNRAYKKLRLSLRELAKRASFDASDLSGILAEVKTPPNDLEKLKKLAKALEIEEGSSDFDIFMDLAIIQAGKEAECLANLEEIKKGYPFLLRFIDGSIPTIKDYESIIEVMRNGN